MIQLRITCSFEIHNGCKVVLQYGEVPWIVYFDVPYRYTIELSNTIYDGVVNSEMEMCMWK